MSEQGLKASAYAGREIIFKGPGGVFRAVCLGVSVARADGG